MDGEDRILRPYQQAIVNRVIRSDKDQVVVCPTGAGKTVMAGAIMKELPGTKIFIVPRLELIGQSKREFGDVDVIWSNRTDLTGKSVIVASKDSLRTQVGKVKIGKEEPLTLFYDEAHIGIKQTHSLTEVLRKKYPQVRALGLTATPERMDGLALLKGYRDVNKYGVFDEAVEEETVFSLIQQGMLAPLKYYAKPIEGITDIRPDSSNGEELSGDQMLKVMDEKNIWGDIVKCYEKYGMNRPAIGFTVTVAMAERVAKLFTDAGYDFRVIHGDMKPSDRKYLIDLLETHQIHGLVNASLLTYGFDCPVVSYAFSVRHIKSRPLWFQMVGRILRTSPGKFNAIFVDHGDSISEFSTPTNPLPILAPKIDWKINGEDKAEKAERKKQAKKAQDAMRCIQSFAPLEVNMVEVTTTDPIDRLLSTILSLNKENASLKDKISEEQQKSSSLEKKLEETSERATQYSEELDQKTKELEEAKKTIDKDATFEYVRKNYGRIRSSFSNIKKPAEQHEMTIKAIRESEPKLSFYFDEQALEKGFEYWRKNYRGRL